MEGLAQRLMQGNQQVRGSDFQERKKGTVGLGAGEVNEGAC